MSGISKRVSGSWVSGDYGIMKAATDTITTLPVMLYSTGSTATVGLKGQTVQSGTPTPDNPIMPQGCGELETSGAKAGQYKIPVSSAGQTTHVYLGEVQTTRQIEKIKLDELNWLYTSTASYSGFYIYGYTTDLIEAAGGYCNKLDVRTGSFISAPNNSITIFESSGNQRLFIRYDDAQGDKTALMTMLNGTVLYGVKTTPTTGIVNEPLMRIGDYTDEVSNISIPVTVGGDTISVETTVQPSEVSVNYHGWHPVADVHERDNGAWT